MKHIVQFSGGKDSTCMLLMMLEKGMQIDEIIFCDTGKEFPQMYEHIDKVEKYIGRPITRLNSDKSFNYYFSEHIKTKGKNKNCKGYGWATMGIRWCTTILKQQITEKYLKSKGSYVSYIGIAYDEEKRHDKEQRSNVIHPLYNWKITEAQALQYCYSKGFDWGGLYKYFDRVSCWCCPLKSIKELRILRNQFPKLWEELKEMDMKSPNQFRADYSVEELEKWFKYEKENNLPPSRIKRKILNTL